MPPIARIDIKPRITSVAWHPRLINSKISWRRYGGDGGRHVILKCDALFLWRHRESVMAAKRYRRGSVSIALRGT